MRTLLKPDAAAASNFETQYASRLALRALTCSQGVTVGRFDTVEKVKTLAVDRGCFAEQDTLLMQYLGLRQISYRLGQPALRPLRELGKPATIPTAGGPEVYAGHAASAAGVAVLAGTRGELTSIEIPGGKKIASLPEVRSTPQTVVLSPNGRVAAVSVDRSSVTFIDTETGSRLWETKAIKFFHIFMPDVGAGLASDGKTGALALVDFQAGTVSAHAVALRDPSWALTISASPARVLLGSGRVFSLIEHVRDGGLAAETVKEYHLKPNQGSPSFAPVLMQDGKTIVFNAGRELTMLELASGKETSWATGDYFTGRFAKLDETTLLVDTYERQERRNGATVLDIADGTLAPVAAGDTGNGILAELPGRTGFIRRGYQEVWLGDTVTTTGEPVSIATVVAAHNLATQMARLETAARMSALTEQSEHEPARATPMMFNLAGGTIRPVTSGSADAVMSGLARAGRIEAVGVYQGASATPGPQGRKVGNVTVRVRRGKAVLLVLSSYEPVRWTLVPEPGAVILGVMVSGYYQSEVVGAGKARVHMAGSQYAYERGSAEYRSLNRQTLMYTGKDIETFQGKYEGSLFTVGD